jgi:hypothetical protein
VLKWALAWAIDQTPDTLTPSAYWMSMTSIIVMLVIGPGWSRGISSTAVLSVSRHRTCDVLRGRVTGLPARAADAAPTG